MKDFKLCNQTDVKQLKDFDFLRFLLSGGGGHCGYSPRGQDNVAKPLIAEVYRSTVEQHSTGHSRGLHCY
jgi:hypothetical protein